MNGRYKNLFIWIVIVVILYGVFHNFEDNQPKATQFTYSKFVQEVKTGAVKDVVVTGPIITGKTKAGEHFATYIPLQDNNLLPMLEKQKVDVEGKPVKQDSMFTQILISWVPIILFAAIWIYFMRQMQGGGKGGPMSFGRSRARMLTEDQVKVTFADVAGCEEAKHEVEEVVDFLKDPGKFQKLGGKIPRGVLLVGQPGTGKTLLAKAVAGEAKVPFFTISGSDFVEMFVGVGASRVRDMFEQAKKQAPCIIFIDEIDAVGRHRGAGLGGGHDEREQTLNQLLVEMDGFGGSDGVIVMAATNRPDVLDPALLRPGRFDRQVVVPLPDIKGREQIMQVHLRKVPLAGDANAAVIARGTPGFSGADLANLVNEAALFAARDNKKQVDMNDLERAKDKILMGSERRSMVMDEGEKKLTAYHEAGHAIIGLTVPSHDPVYKVTIIPRGRALGVTMFLPERDRYSMTREHLESQLCSLYGGRLAELIIFGKDKITTGASNDLERATEIAHNMVTKWGLTDAMGPMTYGKNEDEVFLGRSVQRTQEVSDDTSGRIDAEVRAIVDRNYERAKKILEDKIDILHAMSAALMKYETIDENQLKDLMEGKEPKPPKDWIDPEETVAKVKAELREQDQKLQQEDQPAKPEAPKADDAAESESEDKDGK